MYKFDREAYERRMEWYRDARFGMFIHWGLYAIPARGEWVRSTEQIPKEDYMKYFESQGRTFSSAEIIRWHSRR